MKVWRSGTKDTPGDGSYGGGGKSGLPLRCVGTSRGAYSTGDTTDSERTQDESMSSILGGTRGHRIRGGSRGRVLSISVRFLPSGRPGQRDPVHTNLLGEVRVSIGSMFVLVLIDTQKFVTERTTLLGTNRKVLIVE